MKLKLVSLFAVIIAAITLINCERDDLCASEIEKTPKMVIEFRNISDQEKPRGVPRLRINGVGIDNPLQDYNAVNASKVLLPLNTKIDTTKYVFHYNYVIDDNDTPDDTSDDKILGNKDTLSIYYDRENKFISRACGFKTIYNNVGINIKVDDKNWIRLSKPANEKQTVENEPQEDAHYYLYF